MDSTTTNGGGKFITLVAPDGGPVPLWERDAPIVPAFDPDEESDPATWPAIYDNWRWEPTDDPAELDAVAWGLRADCCDVPEDDDEGRPTAAEAVYEPSRRDLDWHAAQAEALDRRSNWLHQVAAWNDARERGEPWAV
jgi:hypothetical protein